MKAALLLVPFIFGMMASTATRAQTPMECRNVETTTQKKGRFCLSREGKWVLVSDNLERTQSGVNVPGCPRPAPIRDLPAADAGDAAFEDARRRLVAVRDFTNCVRKQAESAGGVAQESALQDVELESASEFNVYMQLYTQLLREKGAPPTPAGVFIEGTHYLALKSPRDDLADVVMFTTLECRRCDYEELLLNQFKSNRPDVSVAIVSGQFGYSKDRTTSFSAYSKAEIIADLSGDPWRDRIRKALRQKGAKRLSGDDDVRQLYLGLGYDPKKLDEMLNSVHLKLKLRSSQSNAAIFQIWSMPTYVVRGRYAVPETMLRTDGSTATNPKKLLDVVDHLLKQTH